MPTRTGTDEHETYGGVVGHEFSDDTHVLKVEASSHLHLTNQGTERTTLVVP